MIVWSGRGFLSVLVLIACFFLFTWALPQGMGDYVFILSFLIAALFSWFMGKRWNASVTATDDVTGQQATYSPNHSLFWIKMQYWGFIFAAFALIILVQQFI